MKKTIILILFLVIVLINFVSAFDANCSTTLSDYVAYDDFTDTDGKALPEHTLNQSGGLVTTKWQLDNPTWENWSISNNMARTLNPSVGDAHMNINLTETTGNKTVEFWFNSTLSANGEPQYELHDNTGLRMCGMLASTTSVSYLSGGYTGFSPSITINANFIYKFRITADNINNRCNYYVIAGNNNSVLGTASAAFESSGTDWKRVDILHGITGVSADRTFIDNFTIYNGSSCISSINDTTAPVISNINFTSCGGDTTEPYNDNCGDTTPTYTFDTDEAATCKISITNHSNSFQSFNLSCTTTGGTSHICTINDTYALAEGNSSVYAACNDTLGNNNTILGAGNEFFTILTIDYPTVTLLNPLNFSINSSIFDTFTTYPIIFNASAWDASNISKLTVYGNWTGTWAANISNTSTVTNNTAYNFTPVNLPIGNYLWNVFGCDSSDNCNYSNVNYTFTIVRSNLTLFNVTLEKPENRSLLPFNMTIGFNFTYKGAVSILNCSMFTNESGWSVKSSLTNVSNATITNFNVNFTAKGNYLWNVLCYDNAIPPNSNYSINNYSFRIDYVIGLSYCNGVILFRVTPNASNATGVQPLNQSTSNCTFNITNNDRFNFTFQLRLTSLIGYYPDYLVEDFTQIAKRWQVNNPESVVRNTTIPFNWSKLCMDIASVRDNVTQGQWAGRIRYFTNNTEFREYLNTSGNVFNTTINFNCTRPINYVNLTLFTNFPNATNITNFTGFDFISLKYLTIDLRSNITNSTTPYNNLSINHTFWLQIISGNGTAYNTSEYKLNDSRQWYTVYENISKKGLQLGNLSNMRIYVNVSNNESVGFYVDELMFNSSTIKNEIAWRTNSVYTYSSSYNLTTSFQNVTNITSGLSFGLPFWFDYYNPSRGTRYSLSQLEYNVIER
ncbi:hypothetical protein HYU06_05890 [Candidatus Woesearchaeota archaeon]|nr:hypothetical protein [Candidatus Woesearchaeota archaeon]